jgi:cell volume regulation protein A
LVYNATQRWGVPAFLIFMGIGLLFGDGRWGEPVYDNPRLTEFISSLALNLIIFAGGFQTPLSAIRKALREGLVLSTAGVLLTALLLGYFTWWATGLPLLTALLFGAIVSSTDAAVVFGILQSKQLKLKHDTGTVLEFESATNDPMAMILVTVLTGLALNPQTEVLGLVIALDFSKLLVIGIGIGLLLGALAQWLLRRISFQDHGLVPIVLLALFLMATYGAQFLGGNLLVASYIFGVMAGNTPHGAQRHAANFNSSLSWLAQAAMFLLLGLQIFAPELPGAFLHAWAPALFLIFMARPLAVLLCYLPFRGIPRAKKIFTALIGLKGATPIVFVLIPVLAGIPHSNTLLHMVFYAVLFSILLQGTLLGWLARKLDLIESP